MSKNPRATKSLGARKRIPPPCVVCGKPSRQSKWRMFLRTCSLECEKKSKAHNAAKVNKLRRISASPEEECLNHRRRTKLMVLDHYSNGTMKCGCCSEDSIEFLTIDHINGGGHSHRKSLGKGNAQHGGGALYTWLIRNNYPHGYRVLCQNCNFSMGVFGYCPHSQRNSELETAIESFIRNGNLRKIKDASRARYFKRIGVTDGEESNVISSPKMP